MAKLSLPKLEVLAIEGGYTGIAALSNFSAVLLLSASSAWLHDYSNWSGAGYELTEDEMLQIQLLVSAAEQEVMMSAVGLIFPIATAAVPQFMLLCDGASHLRTDYPELYEVLDPVFIVDADNFVTPDLQNRFVLGSPSEPVGSVGGSDEHTLSVSQLPSHAHSYTSHTALVTPEGGGVPVPGLNPLGLPSTTGNTGSGNTVNHQNKYMALLYGIVSGQ